MKYENFLVELNYIKDERLKENAKIILNNLPDYFYQVQAASTGKYHPKYALGEAGLVRHTKAAVRFAFELLNDPSIGDKYTDKEKDLMIMGLILHDGLKLGHEKERYTRFDHPILMQKFVEDSSSELEISEEEAKFVGNVIKTHMGVWTTDYNGNEVLEKPKDKYQNFVHMCDYLASRKSILFEFDDNNNLIY